MKRISVFLLLALALVPSVLSQDETDPLEAWEGTSFSFNIGYYHANSYHANFYNGSSENTNKMSYVLGNPYWREEINQMLSVTDTFVVTGLPADMGYNPAMSLGFSIRYSDNGKGFGFIRFGFVRLTSSDYVTIEVDPNTFPTFPDIRLVDIYGVENRMLLDIGYTIYRPLSDQVDWFMQVGANMTNVDVVAHKLRIENKQYNLVDIYGGQVYVPGLPLQEYVVDQGGIGIGLFGGAGIRLNVGEGAGFEIGTDVYVKNINLPGYIDYKPHFNVYARLSMRAARE